MRFFKFIGPDNMSLTKEYDKILYKKGETIVVENADLNNYQCSSGIHCIAFDSIEIDYNNILFGPNVAILEAEESNIIYSSKYGKCRLREAKVVDIIKTEELPDEIKYDKATPGFSIDVLSYSEKVKYSENC